MKAMKRNLSSRSARRMSPWKNTRWSPYSKRVKTRTPAPNSAAVVPRPSLPALVTHAPTMNGPNHTAGVKGCARLISSSAGFSKMRIDFGWLERRGFSGFPVSQWPFAALRQSLV